MTFAGGEVVAQQVALSNPALPQRLTGIQGRIIFSQTGGAQFEQVSAHLGDTQLQINGQIGGGANSLFQDFVVRTRGSAAHLRQLVSPGSFPDDLLSGLLSTRLILSGPTATPHLRGDIILNDAKLTLPTVGEKAPGEPASIELEADVVRGIGLTIMRMELVIPPLRVPLKGKIVLGNRFSIDAEVATGTVSLSSLPEWINKGGIEAGNFEVSMDIMGQRCRLEELAHERMGRPDQRAHVDERIGRSDRRLVSPAQVLPEPCGYQTAVLSDQRQRPDTLGKRQELDNETPDCGQN